MWLLGLWWWWWWGRGGGGSYGPNVIGITQQTRTRDIYPMLDQCWASVVDGGPTLVQHWVDVIVSFMLGQPRMQTVVEQTLQDM